VANGARAVPTTAGSVVGTSGAGRRGISVMARTVHAARQRCNAAPAGLPEAGAPPTSGGNQRSERARTMSDTATVETPTAGLSVTESAARRVRTLIDAEGDPTLMLRVAVSGGGCSGFQYGFDLDTAVADDDRVLERHGVKVVIDEASLDLLAGSEVDYVEDLMGAAFVVRNPNATSTCGCGTSFSM